MLILLLIPISFCMEFSPISGLESGGTTVTILGGFFVPVTDLSCIFGSNSSPATYYNVSHITCQSPPGSGLVLLQVSDVTITSIGNFQYYEALSSALISPLSGSDLLYHTLSLSNLTKNPTDNWSLKLGTYTSHCTSDLLCSIPPLAVLQLLDSSITNIVPLFLARNSQQYEDSLLIFEYELSNLQLLNGFKAKPINGPTTGNTVVTVSVSSIIKLYLPLCNFGGVISPGYSISAGSFLCNSPAGINKVKLTISANGVDFSGTGQEFFYDKIAITSYYPSQGTVSGKSFVLVKGSFMPYSIVYCRFGDLVTIGLNVINTILNCTTPAQSEQTVEFSLSYNQQDYYDVGPYTYRTIETVNSLSPSVGPSSGGTAVTITMGYINSTAAAYCRIGLIFKTQLLEGGVCYMPPLSQVTSPVRVFVSSNDIDYETFQTFTYYPQLTLTSISPPFVPDTLMSRTYTLTGTNFINTGLITVILNNAVYPGVFISSTSISFTVGQQLVIGRSNVTVSLNSQNYSPSIVYLEVYKEPVLLSVNPNFGFLKGGIRLAFRGLNFVYSETIFCRFDSVDVVGSFLTETQVACINPTQTSAGVVQVSITFNGKLNFTGTLPFEYFATPTLPSINPTKSFNQEKPLIYLNYSPARPLLMVKVGQVTCQVTTTSSGFSFTIPGYSSGSVSMLFTYNFLESQSGLSFSFASECVAGKYCPPKQPYSQITCPPGYFCASTSSFLPLPCAPGTFSLQNSSSCTPCTAGGYCPQIASSSVTTCPIGYICNTTSLAYAPYECDAGYFCYQNLKKLCPEGFWCGLRTGFSSPQFIGDFLTPQRCHDGYYCGTGSSTAYGSLCSSGYYCASGLRTLCPAGSYCVAGAAAPAACLPGFYSSTTGQAQCKGSNTGYICPGSNNTQMTICPAGYVCSIRGRPTPFDVCPGGNYCLEGTKTNTTDSSNSPIQCSSGTYCLMGCVSGDIVDGNVKYAQTCIQGTYCVKGESSPEATACPEGSYCPTGASLPNMTDEGFYASGLGNAQQQPCPAGNYSNVKNATACPGCPAGYFCPYDNMTTPIICSAGTYRELISTSIYCELCPEGTYSSTPGLSSISQCTPCSASIICLNRGLSSLNTTTACPEGYICSTGTTSTSLEKSPCPGGFWCDKKTSQPADFGICDPGFYCPQATGISSKNQFVCLAGYYCPPGTNAMLNSQGGYEFINSSDYSEVMQAKKDYNANCSSPCVPKDIPSFPICERDVRIPEVLRKQYTDLICPNGTTSESKATCVGDCLPSMIQTTIFNPSIASKKRRLGEVESISIDAYNIALLVFDFSKINKNFWYNTDFSVVIWGSDGNELDLPVYLQVTNTSFFHLKFEVSIINLSNDFMNITAAVSLHNDLFIPFIPELESSMNITIIPPSRAVIGSNLMFAALLWVNSFGDVAMPVNMLDLTKPDGSQIDLWLLDAGTNSEWFGQTNQNPYDSSYWINYGVNSVAFPWLPYFMNCEHFGDRIHIHRLLETMDNCSFYTVGETIIVLPMPVTGVSPKSDTCSMIFQCYYAENVQPTSSVRWFEINQVEVLYLLTRQPISPDAFTNTMTGQDSGFTQSIQDLDDKVIQVSFAPSGAKAGLPTLVTMDIAYYQKDASSKLLVSASVTLSQYSADELNSATPGYRLAVNYYALGWFDLLNKFQFDVSIFILLFTIIGLVILAIGYLVYRLHMIAAKDPPEMHFRFYLWVSSLPPTVGVLPASLPIVLAAYILTPLTAAFLNISADWAVEPPLSPDQITAFQRGRIGMCLGFVAFTFFVYGAKLLIPKPDPPEEEEEGAEGEGEGAEEAKEEEDKKSNKEDKEGLDDENHDEVTDAVNDEPSEREERKEEEGKDADEPEDENEAGEDDEEENEEEEGEFPMWDAMKVKRRYFMLACLSITVICSIKLEVSYTPLFSANIMAFQVGFSLLDILIKQVFTRVVLNEALLVVPILASLSINKAIMMLASPNFTVFMEVYILNFGMVILERIYINPFIEYFELKLQNTLTHLVAKFWLFKKIFGNVVLKTLLEEKKLMTSMKGNFSENETHERMMGTMVQFSANSLSLFMMPLVYLLINLFSDASEIPKSYMIKKSDVNYYLLFAALIIIPQLILDVYMLHLIESLYHYKLFDYLTYCSHRFRTRLTWWKYTVDVQLDKSLQQTWRSIDCMCFSSQFYFTTTLAAWGIVCLTISFTIMIRNAFHPCGDPMIFAFFFIVRYLGTCLKKLFVTLRPYIRLWVPSPHPIFVEEIPQNDSDDQIVELIEEYAIENELVHKLQTDIFRAKFLKKNIPFIVENLEAIIEDNPTCHNYLKKRYQILFDYHLVSEKERNYVEHRLDLLKLLPNNKFDSEFEVSFERESFEAPPIQRVDESAGRIAKKWLSQAKLNLLLKSKIRDDKVLGAYCEICEMTEHLKIVTTESFEVIYNKFQEAYKGFPLRMEQWKRFYYRNQKIRTLCVDCAYLEQLKLKQDPRAFSNLTRVAHEEFKLFKPQKEEISETTEEIVRIWLNAARARLNANQDYGELYTIESVSEQELSAVVSVLEEPEDSIN